MFFRECQAIGFWMGQSQDHWCCPLVNSRELGRLVSLTIQTKGIHMAGRAMGTYAKAETFVMCSGGIRRPRTAEPRAS